MSLKRNISTILLVGTLGLTSYFAIGCTNKSELKSTVQEKVGYVTQEKKYPIYGEAGNNIDELLEYTNEIISKNPEEHENYIKEISRIGIENGYDRDIINMIDDGTIEKRISQMPSERKIKIIEPIIKNELKDKYSQFLDFLNNQKPRVDSFYRSLEKKVKGYFANGGNENGPD
jgi:hypothetical protein